MNTKRQGPSFVATAMMAALIICILMAFIALQQPTTSYVSSAPSAPSLQATHTVVYEVTGSASTASFINYKNLTGGTDGKDDVVLPFKVVETDVPNGTFLDIWGMAKGTVTCNIYVDGTLAKTETSNDAGGADFSCSITI